MKENNKSYLIQLDGIRAIAVLMVMVSHFFSYRAIVLIPLGSMGVNLFFVLSGFLITRILLIEKLEVELKNKGIWESFKTFYYRRTLRIFPIYYLTIALLYIKNISPAREESFWLYSYLMNFKFAMPNVLETGLFGHFVHFWSLCVEEQFYLFFPMFVFIIPQKRMKLFFYFLVFIGLSSRFILYILHAPKNSLYVLTPTCLDAFGVGAILAYLFLNQRDVLIAKVYNKRLMYLSFFIFILDIIISRNFLNNYSECRTVLERFLFCICCFYIIGNASLGLIKGRLKSILERREMLFIGKVSYGLYIYHNFMPYIYYPIVNRIGNEKIVELLNNEGLRGIIYLGLTIGVASVSWYLIELPINNLKNKKI